MLRMSILVTYLLQINPFYWIRFSVPLYLQANLESVLTVLLQLMCLVTIWP